MRSNSNPLVWLVIAVLFAGARVATAASVPALVQAVKAGDRATIRTLLAQPVDVNAAEPDGTTPLMWAIQLSDAETVGLLIQKGADVKAVNLYGIAPLLVACTVGSAQIVERLLAAGADPNTMTPEGETALMTSARTGDVASIKMLVSRGARVDLRESWKGQTALMWAAAENNASAVKVLVELGAEVNAHSKSNAFTALLFAVRAGHIESARALLEAGANVNELMPDGTSPLLVATINAHYELASLLLDRGADPRVDATGWTALHQLSWSRRPNIGWNLPGPVQTGRLDSLELARKLVRLGADVNARQKKEPKDNYRNQLNRIGATPFLLAAKAVDLPYMRLLLELGADPKLTTERGTTPLMAAAGVGIWAPGENPGTDEEALAAVKLCLEVGAGAVTDVDKDGETALHGAVDRAGSIPMAKLFLSLGAKLDVPNSMGWTPLILADGAEYTPNVLKRYPEMAAFLRQAYAERGLPVPAPLDSPPTRKQAVRRPAPTASPATPAPSSPAVR